MIETGFPRISFGIIVLNGEPFIRYCLRSLYPFAHQIIVVEGGSEAASSVSTPDGHSIDGTLNELSRFKKEEDPENKLEIVVKDGFWSEKDEQSAAYAARATGDYLWQVDIDEFYLAEDVRRILKKLSQNPEITAVSFKQITFWGGFDYYTDGWYLRNGADIYHRLFKWGPGYRYLTHRPPTVIDDEGTDLRKRSWIKAEHLAKENIFLYHYSLAFPKQVKEKAEYYARHSWGKYSSGVINWAQENFLSPVRSPYRIHNVHNHPSWIKKYKGTHPEQILKMNEDILQNRIEIECRNNSDIERLERMKIYRVGRWMLEKSTCIGKTDSIAKWKLQGLAFRIGYDAGKSRLYFRSRKNAISWY